MQPRKRFMKGQTMNASIYEIHKKSGDATIGQTLLRLARLAEAAHQNEMNETLLELHHAETDGGNNSRRHGWHDGPESAQPQASAAVHTEVNP